MLFIYYSLDLKSSVFLSVQMNSTLHNLYGNPTHWMCKWTCNRSGRIQDSSQKFIMRIFFFVARLQMVCGKIKSKYLTVFDTDWPVFGARMPFFLHLYSQVVIKGMCAFKKELIF